MRDVRSHGREFQVSYHRRVKAIRQLCMAANAVQFDKRTYTVDEIQDILGISRTSAYNLVKKKVFHSVRIGGSIRISKKSFDEWLDHQM